MLDTIIPTILAVILVILSVSLLCVTAKAQEQEEAMYIYIWEVSKEFDISPFLLASLVYQESRFIVTDNLTQIQNPIWFAEGLEYCESDDISNPYVNLRCCAYYLNKWSEEKDAGFAIMAWHRGYENALKRKRWDSYTNEVMGRMQRWEKGWLEREVDE